VEGELFSSINIGPSKNPALFRESMLLGSRMAINFLYKLIGEQDKHLVFGRNATNVSLFSS